MSYRLVQLPLISMAFLSLLVLAVLLAAPALADSPFDKDAIELDWVCVTDAALVDAYAPLAAHRQSQGLASIVLPLDEVIRWSPAGDDTIATLRWLSGVAVNQWGAQYLLLGGSHALLPSPIHRLVTPNYDFDHPIDTYFSCLDGQWDVDGDGLFAETEDAAEPTIHIALGRIPADDVISVNNIVSKILAFEQRPLETTRGALFVSVIDGSLLGAFGSLSQCDSGVCHVLAGQGHDHGSGNAGGVLVPGERGCASTSGPLESPGLGR